MNNPIEKLKEFYVKFGDILNSNDERTKAIMRKIIVGSVTLTWLSGILWFGVSSALEAKENKDFINGKFNPSIKESNVLSVSEWSKKVKLDINGNGKFDKGDISFFDWTISISKDAKSVVYIDGVGKKKPLAYKRENGEYIIYKTVSSYLKKSENLNKEFYDYMKDKKVFDLVKAEREISAHTK